MQFCSVQPKWVNTEYIVLKSVFSEIQLRTIHATGKAFAGGKGFRGLCRLPAAKQTGKTAKENGEICPLYRHKLCNFADNKVIKE